MTTLAEEQNVVQAPRSSHRVAETLLRFRELGIVLALVLVVGATTIDNHLFLSATSVQQLLSGAAIIALLAIGETIVIVTRNVDLSIGSVLGMADRIVVLFEGSVAREFTRAEADEQAIMRAATGMVEEAA